LAGSGQIGRRLIRPSSTHSGRPFLVKADIGTNDGPPVGDIE